MTPLGSFFYFLRTASYNESKMQKTRGMQQLKSEIQLLPSERLDYLVTEGLHIIQSREVFSFSMDAVLLAKFANIPHYGKIADLCSGNAVIPLLLSARTKAHIHAVEIQPRLADMARRSVAINELEEKITVVEGDLRIFPQEAGQGAFDYVTVNPPYMPGNTGDQNDNIHFAMARHELNGTLDQIVEASARLLRTGGKMAMVHRPERLMDIMMSLRNWRLEPKRLRFIHPYAGAEANMVLIEAIRGGKPAVKILPPLVVYNKERKYEQEIMELYYGTESEPT